MHQRMQSGSMARAPSTVPISGHVEPELIEDGLHVALRAVAWLPQMNIVGLTPLKSGLTMNALPTQLNDFDEVSLGVRAPGAAP